MSRRFTATLRVRSYELDSFGHVNNATYLQYLEYARGEYLRQQGLSFSHFQDWDAIPYVLSAEINYKSSARAEDELEINGEITNWGRCSFVLDYQVFNKTSNKLAASASLKFAFVNSREKIIPIPKAFRHAME